MERLTFIVSDAEAGLRIDQFLAARIPSLSRRKVRAILDVGGCYVNDRRLHIASRTVRGGDKVRVEYSLEGLSKSKQKVFVLKDEDILFDQDQVLAINKPPGLPSQATRDQDVMHAEVCLKNWLKDHKRGGSKLILVHRLDKETSGVLLFATDAKVATALTDLFRARAVKKTYWAICFGLPPNDEYEVSCYLTDIDQKSGRVSVVPKGGKSSKTKFKVLERFPKAGLSLWECYPETGRSHQIRVHLEYLGFPIVGDKRYGESLTRTLKDDLAPLAAQHHMLHAKKIMFPSPKDSRETVEIEAILPQSFLEILNRCKK